MHTLPKYFDLIYTNCLCNFLSFECNLIFIHFSGSHSMQSNRILICFEDNPLTHVHSLVVAWREKMQHAGDLTKFN